MPRIIEFKDEKTENLFFEDVKKIMKENIFANEMYQKAQRKDPFIPSHIAYNYVEKFNKLEKTQNNFDALLDALDEVRRFETNLSNADKNKHNLTQQEIIHLHDSAINHLMNIANKQPSLKDMFEDFRQVSGASLADDDMRILNSVIQTIDNLSDRLDLERRNAEYNKIAQDETNMLSSLKEINDDIKSFAEQCDANNVDGIKFDEVLAVEEKKCADLKIELANLENKENWEKHSEKYIECANRVSTLKDEEAVLLNNFYETQSRFDELADLDSRMSGMDVELKKAESQYQKYTVEEERAERLMNNLDAQIAEEERKAAVSAAKGQNYLNSSEGKFVQNRIHVSNQYIYENHVLQSSLTTFEAMNNGLPKYNLPPFDISESYRLYRSGDLDESTLSQHQRAGLDSYIQTKRAILDINPDYGDDFKKFEDDPQNKIPGDIEKIIGTKIREAIADKKAYIELAQKTDFTKYNEAMENIAKAQSKANLIQDLKAERVAAENSLQEARRNKESVSSVLQNWKKLPLQTLKDAFPKGDNVTIKDVRAIISAEKEKLGKQMKEIWRQAVKNTEAIKVEKSTLSELHEGLYAIKKNRLETQIQAKELHIKTVNKLKVKGDELRQKVQETNTKLAEYQKSDACKPTVPSPLKKITDRLTYIQENFTKVQSFWSRGMSPECQNMFDQLGETIKTLNDPKSSTATIQDSLLTLTDFSKKYLDAKKAQNVPKSLASQQRYWRLAFAEEMVNMSRNASYVIEEADKNPSVKAHEGFMKTNYDKAAKSPDAVFNTLVDKQVSAIKAQKTPQKTRTKEAENLNNSRQKQNKTVQNNGMHGLGGR